jgi:internalin A
LPKSIGQLQHLAILDLSQNQLATLPDSIGDLQNLEWLLLNSNELSTLPESIGALQRLNALTIPENNLIELPTSIGELHKLGMLYLQNNRLTKLPQSIKNLRLEHLSLSDNPITKNIKEIEEGLAPKELITYLLTVQNKETKPLNEAKILVVGDERVGKTSVINRLIGKPHDPNQQSTFGIDILKHSLKNDIQVNIWDFAGQEITHQTHQFFLSSRSLYVYVLDSQKEDNDSGIFHWLSVIKTNGDNSPMIIVVNKRDLNQGYSFDINRYKKDFNIVDVLYLSATAELPINEAMNKAINKNITHNMADLTHCIEKHVAELKHIEFPLPASWAAVKAELEDMSVQAKDFIENDDYATLCVKHGIDNDLLQNTLLTILNQIGTVVTYRDYHQLSMMQIINPLWVTNGVYRIIRSPLIENAILEQNKFTQIFKDDKQYRLWLAG